MGNKSQYMFLPSKSNNGNRNISVIIIAENEEEAMSILRENIRWGDWSIACEDDDPLGLEFHLKEQAYDAEKVKRPYFMKVPCGRTMGHGESCVEGYMCDQCSYIKSLEEFLKLKGLIN